MFLPHATYRLLTEIPDSISTPVATVAESITATPPAADTSATTPTALPATTGPTATPFTDTVTSGKTITPDSVATKQEISAPTSPDSSTVGHKTSGSESLSETSNSPSTAATTDTSTTAPATLPADTAGSTAVLHTDDVSTGKAINLDSVAAKRETFGPTTTDTTGVVGFKVSDAENLPATNDTTNRETSVTTPATSQEIVGPATADTDTAIANPEVTSLENPSATKKITPTTTATDTTERDSVAYSGTSVNSPATIPATADTANIETKAAGTENLPAASDTLFLSPDSLGTVADSLSSEPPAVTIDIHPGLPAPLRPANAPLRDDGLFVLLLAGLVLFLLSVRYRKKIFSWQSDGDSEHRRDSNRTKHLIGINAHLRNIFLAFTFIIEGTLGAIALHVADLPLPFPGGYATNALLFALPAALYFLLQQGIFVLLTTLFSTDTRGREWCDTHIFVNLLLGICLYPFAFLSTYLPETASHLLIASVCIYIMARILFIIKGVKLFLRDFRCLLYFILYLCALEIAPLLLLGKCWGLL